MAALWLLPRGPYWSSLHLWVLVILWPRLDLSSVTLCVWNNSIGRIRGSRPGEMSLLTRMSSCKPGARRRWHVNTAYDFSAGQKVIPGLCVCDVLYIPGDDASHWRRERQVDELSWVTSWWQVAGMRPNNAACMRATCQKSEESSQVFFIFHLPHWRHCATKQSVVSTVNAISRLLKTRVVIKL